MRIICLLFGMALAVNGFAQLDVNAKALRLVRMMQKYHVQPLHLNDTLSQRIYMQVLDQLDPFRIIFKQDDLAVLGKFRFQLDDDIKALRSPFIESAVKVYGAAYKRFYTQVGPLLEKPFNWNADIKYTPAVAGKQYTDVEVARRGEHFLQYQVAEQLSYHVEDEDEGLSMQLIAEHEAEARKQISKRIAERSKKLNEDNSLFKLVENIYLHSIASSFDPHSAYMSADEKEGFEEQLSSEALRFGFSFEEDEEGNYTIDAVSPGSAAWKSNNIFENDKLIAIKTSDGKTIVLKNSTPEEVDAIMDKYAEQALEFTLQSADGKFKTVSLKKEVMRNDENIVRGWILDGPARLGYISLPSFYTKHENNIGTSCAEDLAREILKLKKDKIEGLIIDLRYNGGGDVREAAELLSLFIDVGPLGQLKYYNGETDILKDVNRGSMFDGPLAIMINGASASASEILAGTLQDYNRAFITGSNSFGKATMQSILPLDTSLNMEQIKMPEDVLKLDNSAGYAKITLGRLYRVTGESAQQFGVKPDLLLPDEFEIGPFAEKDLPFSLHKDAIDKKLVPRFGVTIADKNTAIQKVIQEVGSDPYFIDLKEKHAKARSMSSAIPLSIEGYNLYLKNNRQDNTEKDSSMVVQDVYKVKNSIMDAGYNNIDSYRKTMDAILMVNYASDPYLIKTYQLLRYALNK